MKKLLLVVLALGMCAMMFAQSWEVVKETTVPVDPGEGPNASAFIDANTGWLVNDEGRVQMTTDGGNTWTTLREAVAGSNDWEDVDFVDANTGYACADDGEIFKTADGGTTWTMVADTAYAVDLFHLDAVTADVVYFTGKDGVVLKTVDGGTTFTQVAETFDGEDLDGGIAFTTENMGIVLMDGNGGLSWYTHDGGATWTLVSLAAYFPPGTSSTRMYDIAAAGASTFVATGYHYVTVISTDGGVNWTRVGGLSYGYDRNEIVNVIDENTFLIAGDFLALTTDAGVTFDTLSTGSGQGFNIVEFSDINTGFVNQDDGVWKTTSDGGDTWNAIYDWPGISFWGIGLPSDDNIVISGWGGGEISTSTDGGNTFNYPSNSLTNTNSHLYECEFLNENVGFLGGGSGLLLKTDDGAASFSTVENPMSLAANKHINAMHVYNENVLFAGGSSGYVMKSSDGGVTWTDTKVQSKTVYDICAIDENTVITGESSGVLGYGVFDASGAIVTDSLIIDVGTNLMRSVKIQNGVVLVAASKGLIYRADVNDLASIEAIFTEPDGDDFYDVVFVDDNIAYAVGEAGKIYKTEDAGVTWIVEVSPTTETLQKVKVGNNKLWAVGQNGTIISLSLTNEPELMTIAAVKVDADTNDVLDLIDQEVKIKGIVTTPNYGSNCSYYLQDETAGILLYGSAPVEVAIGDEIQIIGKVAQYNGLSEVVIDETTDVTVLSSDNVVEPKSIKLSQLGEAYEAMLVSVEPAIIIDPSQWPAEGSNGNVDIVSGSDTSRVFIDKDTELDGWVAPTGWMRIIGVCDQYYSYSLRGIDKENFVELTPTLPITEAFTDGNFDQEWVLNNALGEGSIEIADSTGSAWGSHVGVFTDAGYTGIAHLKNAVIEDYTVSADIFIVGPADANAPLYAGLAIKADHNENIYYRFIYRNSSSADNGQIKLQGYDGAGFHSLLAWNPGTDFEALETGFHNFKVTVKGNEFWAYIDGEVLPGCPIVEDTPFFSAGYPGIFKYNAGSSSILFDNFTVTEPEAAPVSVTFNCDMSVQITNGTFTVGTDVLDVAGNFNGWGGTAPLLTDDNEDQVYTTVVTGLTPGETLEYKFRINSNWDTSEFPSGGPNRTYLVPDSNSTVSVFYNDETVPNAIDDDANLPGKFALHQNYPNPFNPTTSIAFDLAKDATVRLDIYNLQGQRVAKVKNEVMQAGYYNVNIDASHLASGVYIYKIQADNFVSMKKMTLLK